MKLTIPEALGRTSVFAGAPRNGAARFVLRLWRKSSIAGLAAYTLALGAVLGLASADWATSGGYPFGGVQVGAWTAWPRAGAANADPYTRAVNARRGEIPLAVGEGLLLTAAVDDSGQALDATCTYRIGGATPPARAWTVTVAGRGAREPGRAPLREGFTSTEVLRTADGRFTITLAPDVQPGNWLPSPRASGPVRLALRLYDTPVAASVGSLDRSAVPAITRVGCAP
ncbi:MULTISPECIES: DUF1214 domain-containing protein [Methylobacterium]|jgi:hypothetical protein|uniref:DUF1214 domain-containing protein n=1 Tax=Methylobacterium TaxID=407 RepID=UPI00034DDFFC|nr:MULTISPECIES: DUF1214 domain-containing protein [Methylobacterium]KQS81919.1 hypothetical protein ASG32_04025 [Methylobacterium sp. Leaf361]MBN4094367.1 DUF1214 domain-containing protein [Methylobacterium sp. OT2]UIN33214.1 DUF1214 domain-containing protein [Methylobacterium oryzae]SEG25511.1 hypothetical protein SAMN04488144_11275 [Methylobacterium sp. 190mf]SEH76012.1 hypothetical protein SAMN02799636_03754 [Methylobacterium sp. 275MFSha3.1]